MNLITFFSVTFLSYLSVIGFGKLINNKIINYKDKNNNFKSLLEFLIGVIFLSVLGFINYFLSITNIWFNFGYLLIGLIIFFFYNGFSFYKDLSKDLIILFILFSSLLISKTHEDFIPYHFPFIEFITNSNLLLGIGNLELNFIYTPLIAYMQKLFVLPFFEYKFLHIPIFLIFFSIINFLTKDFFENKKINLVYFFILIFYLLKFTRISEFGYDYVVTFLLTILFILFIQNLNNLKNNPSLFLFLLIFIFAISIKSISIFYLPILIIIIHILYNLNFFIIKKYIIKSKKVLFLFFFLLFVYFLEGFLKSGCVINFIFSSCLQEGYINWNVDKNEILNFSKHVELWAKGFYHQDKIITNNPNHYIEFPTWVSNWYKVHFHYKVFEFLIILTSLVVVLLFLSNDLKYRYLFNRTNLLIIGSSLMSICFWFLLLPQLRFGAGAILIFYLSIVGSVSQFIYRKYKNRKIFISILILVFLFFNFKNFNRINDEFKRQDKYQFKNFPFISVIDYAKPGTYKSRYKKELKKLAK